MSSKSIVVCSYAGNPDFYDIAHSLSSANWLLSDLVEASMASVYVPVEHTQFISLEQVPALGRESLSVSLHSRLAVIVT